MKPAGEQAGILTADRLREVDPGSTITADIPLCPPEGDAGTGMIATNSVRQRTGNVSAGTSVFAMIVLEKSLTRAHSEIDLIVTPDGSPVAMAHSNNCMSDTDAWIKLLGDAATALGGDASTGNLYTTLMRRALDADPDAGGLTAIPYVSGEHGTGFSQGRPLFVRNDNASFTLSNFIRSLLYSAICAMRIGLDVLFEREQVKIDEIRGHGGFFKTPGVGQRIMAAATKSPCTVMETAGEGGSWGMALLAAFLVRAEKGGSLPRFLDQVFSDAASSTLEPLVEDMEGFDRYLARYKAALSAERAAVENLD
ncbi:MAG: FGGY-family carbohydrate kinase [Spirochaetales bacterium]